MIVSVIMIWNVCTQVTNAGQKLNNISSAIVDNIENRCQCRFIRDRITDEAFQCTDNALEAVAYAATVHGTASVNSSLLISHIEQWATDGATVTVLHEVLNISNMGPTKGECCTEMTVTKEVTSYESSDHYSEEVTSSESSDHYSQEVTSSELSDHYTEEVISSESSDHYSQKVTSSKSSDHYTEEVTSSESSDHYTEEVTSSESFNHYSEEVTSSESSLNETQAKPKDNDHTLFIIIGGGSGGGVVIIVIIIIVVIAVIVKCKSRKHGKLR